MPATTWDLVLDEAQRANREQQQQLEVLRGRTALLVAATVPAGALLSNRSHPEDGWREIAWWTAAGGAAFAAIAALVLALLILRHREWDFRPDLGQLITKAGDEGTSVEQLQRGMSERFKLSWSANQKQLDELLALFVRGLVVLVVEYGCTFFANGVAL